MEPEKSRKKVVVCGGGVIGVATAYFLSKKGAAVTIVEKSSIACAASGKAGGFLALDWCDGGPVSLLARASFNLHRSLADELHGSDLYGYRALTTLSLTIRESDATSESQSSKNSKTLTIPPWIDGNAKGGKTIGTTETTAQVHPELFTKTLLSKAIDDFGVKVVIGKVSTVTAVEGTATAVVLDNGQEITADAVVLALGPWSSKLPLLGSRFRIHGLKAHSIVIQPNDPDTITPHALFLTYHPVDGGNPMDPEVYPRPTGEVYICGMAAESAVPDEPEEVTPVPESIAILKKVMMQVSSQLTEVKTEQACFLPCSDDDLPVIGELPGLKGCYAATGHSCWGILNAPATGMALSELVMDGEAEIVDLTPFSPSRFVRTAGA